MKVLILAAGLGTRLQPFTPLESKILFPFLGKPLLLYHLDEFAKHNFNHFIIVCNKDNYERIRRIKDKLFYHIDLCIQDPPLGPADAIYTARSLLAQDDFFLVKYGDSVSLEDQIQPLLKTFISYPQDAVVTLRHVDNPSQYGIARFEGEKLVEIVEKPKSDVPSNLAYVGIAIFDRKKFFASLEKNDSGDEIAPAEYMLRKGHSATWWLYRGERVDLGYPWDIVQMNRLFIKKYGPQIRSKNINTGARIDTDVYIGPKAVIGNDVSITKYSSIDGHIGRGSVINNSIVMPGTQVGEYSLLEASVVGKYVNLGTKFTAQMETYRGRKNKRRNRLFTLGCYIGDNVVLPDRSNINAGTAIYSDFSKVEDLRKEL